MTRKSRHPRREQPPGETELCYRHERPLSLFCRDADCHALLCHVCYVRHHNGHDAVDLIAEAKKHKHSLKDLIQTTKGTCTNGLAVVWCTGLPTDFLPVEVSMADQE